MRLAVLADIHGNLPAFEAALAHARQQGYDQMVLLGDMVVCAPDSAGCWHLAGSLGVPMLRGNHERYVAHYGTPQASPLWTSAQFAPVQWAVEQLTGTERQEMGELPTQLRLDDWPDLLLVHACVRSDRENVFAHTPESDLVTMFAGAEEGWIVRGHDHASQTRIWGGRTIVTVGSVGLPMYGGAYAHYTLLEQTASGYRIQHHAVEYDLGRSVERFYSSGYLEQAGPMARLFLRELVTASQYLVPFLQWYGQQHQAESSREDLEQAVDRFLNAF